MGRRRAEAPTPIRMIARREMEIFGVVWGFEVDMFGYV